MGLLNAREQENENHLMNPMAKSLSASMAKLVKHKVLSSLVNETDTQNYYREMFEDNGVWDPAERSINTSIPPAHVRIKNFSRKQFKDYDRKVEEVKTRDDLMYN